MITNKDIDECLIMAELNVNDDIQSALQEFFRSDIEQEAAVLWAGLPESVKKAVRKKAPEAVKRIEEMIK